MRTLRRTTPPVTDPIIVTRAGRLAQAPESVITSNLPALSARGVAVAYCAGTAVTVCCPTRTLPGAPCPGHSIGAGGPLAGQYVVLGRRDTGRALYLVSAVGTAGTRLTRKA